MRKVETENSIYYQIGLSYTVQVHMCAAKAFLCTGGAYYVTYSFRFISNKSWDGGGGEGEFHLIAL